MKNPSPEAVQVPFPSEQTGKLKDFGGSGSDDFNNVLANQIVSTLWLDADPETRQRQFQAAFAVLVGIKPSDEIEGMLAAQLVATHTASMEAFRRGMIQGQTFEGRREALNQANRLTRSFTTLLEALNRHRGKGQQKVTVEHVHVHSGGQAIVGTVQGGGVPRRSEDQPHAPRSLTHEPGTPMRSPDPQRDAVPVAGRARKAPL